MTRRRRWALGWAIPWAAVVLMVTSAPSAFASHGTTSRASLTSSSGQPNGSSAAPAISADGRYVAFASWATDLVPGDTNGWVDIFVRDLTSGATERVSVSSAGAQAGGPSLDATISADGRYVAFWSMAGNLVPPFTANGVFVHDRSAGTTVRASLDNEGFPTLGEFPSISADGRYVAFWTGRVLSPDRFEIGVRDLVSGQTSVVRADSMNFPSGPGSGPVLSADGRYVAFPSQSPNLVTNRTFGWGDVFVNDRLTGLTELVSVSPSGKGSRNGAGRPSISADGRYVAFSGTTDLDDAKTGGYIFVRDRLAGTTTAVDLHTTGEPMEQTRAPVISADGTHVAFLSASTEESRQAWPALRRLPEGADSPVFQSLPSHVYVRDLGTGVTSLASVSTGGQRGDRSSGAPRLSADGTMVAFESWATNLVPDDTNDTLDVFVHDFTAAAPACADGGYEEGPISGRAHEEVEPSAGPGTQPLHEASCAVLVPRGL